MFPLLDQGAPNPLELFQIWLNLPSTHKMVAPHFSMFWAPTIPKQTLLDGQGRATHLEIIAGSYGPTRALAPPPDSYASRPGSDVTIWALRMAAGAQFTLPKAGVASRRMLYFYGGSELRVGARTFPVKQALELRADQEVALENGAQESELLLLAGKPIEEPVVQYGPFVMNTSAEIQQAFADYRRTGFGGWPWPSDGPVHQREERFARHADGRIERGA
jgi:redox-sensitive bicupin YhaK (pirin superfamily)